MITKSSSMSILLKLSLIFGITLCLPQLWAAQAINYCDPKLCEGKKHIACNNSGAFAAKCGKAKVYPFTASDRQWIVKKHNEFRNYVALGKQQGFKTAVRMATMTWDDNLAYLATLNAKQCKMQHDACRKTPTYPKAGQNLSNTRIGGKPRTTMAIVKEEIQQWYDEYKWTTMTNITTLLDTGNFKQIGHFTEMMQDKNNRIGCGLVLDTKNSVTTQYLACDYAFSNVIGKRVYDVGTPASSCTTGKNPDFPGLCSINEVYQYLYNP